MKFIVKVEYGNTHIINTIHCDPTEELLTDVVKEILNHAQRIKGPIKKVKNAQS